jgi:hypothetical protein
MFFEESEGGKLMLERFSLPFETTLKRKQLLLLFALVGGMTLITVSVLVILLKVETMPLEKKSEKKTEITSGSKRVKPQEVWVQRLDVAACTYKRLGSGAFSKTGSPKMTL